MPQARASHSGPSWTRRPVAEYVHPLTQKQVRFVADGKSALTIQAKDKVRNLPYAYLYEKGNLKPQALAQKIEDYLYQELAKVSYAPLLLVFTSEDRLLAFQREYERHTATWQGVPRAPLFVTSVDRMFEQDPWHRPIWQEIASSRPSLLLSLLAQHAANTK